MNKKKIKDGSILTYRNGDTRLFQAKHVYKQFANGEIEVRGHVSNANDDLTHKFDRQFDIVKIEYEGKVVWEGNQ